jgi:uncharacterized membrane protein
MMEDKRVIIANFDNDSKAYEAFSKTKKLHTTRKIKGEQMAVVTHSTDGEHHFVIEDFLDFTGNNKSTVGGFIGMLVGIVGGPIGILVGWVAGGMIGATQDVKEVTTANTLFESLIGKIKEGETGLLLIATEEDNRPLNQLISYDLGGELTRIDYTEAETELKAAREAAKNQQNPAN